MSFTCSLYLPFYQYLSPHLLCPLSLSLAVYLSLADHLELTLPIQLAAHLYPVVREAEPLWLGNWLLQWLGVS